MELCYSLDKKEVLCTGLPSCISLPSPSTIGLERNCSISCDSPHAECVVAIFYEYVEEFFCYFMMSTI